MPNSTSKPKKKFYAVRVGREGSGIYDTWEECRRQVVGVPRAVYKSFPTRQEAQDYIAGWDGGKEPAPAKPWTGAVAYVDGSFDKRSGDFSCGAVLLWNGEQVEFSQRFEDRELSEMHNVAGEIMGAVTVIEYCLEHGIPGVEIHHDYEGVGRWPDGSWRANKPGTKRYAARCQEAMKVMEIRFVKVKGHSGDKYNDMADALARRALGI